MGTPPVDRQKDRHVSKHLPSRRTTYKGGSKKAFQSKANRPLVNDPIMHRDRTQQTTNGQVFTFARMGGGIQCKKNGTPGCDSSCRRKGRSSGVWTDIQMTENTSACCARQLTLSWKCGYMSVEYFSLIPLPITNIEFSTNLELQCDENGASRFEVATSAPLVSLFFSTPWDDNICDAFCV